MFRPRIATHVGFSIAFVSGTLGIGILSRHQDIWNQQQQPFLYFRNPFQFSSSSLTFKQNIPQFIQNIQEIIRVKVMEASPAQKLAWGLIGINALIFGCWQIPRLARFMSSNFLHVPSMNRPWTLITCTFSHSNPMHFMFNMMALHSFLPFLQESKGLSHQQILSFYLTAGCLSSLGSHLFSVMNKSRWMVGGLGASGAIYALVAACAYFHPESRIGIMFVPINFKMKELFPCIVAMDVIGLALKWRHLDHACHLSGALIGYLYAMYGISLWSQIQHDLFHYRKKL